MPEDKTTPDAPGGVVQAHNVPDVEKPPSNDGLYLFVIGGVIGLIFNCCLAFGFFLSVEDNPQVLLRLDLFKWLAPGLLVEVVMIVIAFLRHGWWRVPVGFAIIMLTVLALTAQWTLSNHPIPTQQEKCIALNELYEVLEEGKTIDANTPAMQARNWRSKFIDVYKKNFRIYQFIPKTNIDLMLQEHKALEGREKAGLTASWIHQKILDNQNRLRQLKSVYCSAQ